MPEIHPRTHALRFPLTLMALSLSWAGASGCGSASVDDGGSGGAANPSSGGAATSSGGGQNDASGGAINSTSGGAPGAGGGPGSGGAPSTGGNGNDASGGAGNGDQDAVMPSAGCGPQPPPAAGPASIDVDGLMREYILALPEGYESEKPYKLIFTWHPWGGSAQQVAGSGPNGYYGLLGASNGEAILVSPEGLDFQGRGLGWGNTNGQDLDFMRAMMERFDSELCFDHNRVFSTGFSFGGMMSNAVACAGLARAIAPMAGNSMVSGCEDGTQPVAYMGFHGVSDSVVSLEGGQTAKDVFVERNGCGAAAASESDWCELAGSNYQPCECVTYEGCTEGYPVTWCEYNGDHMVAPNSGETIWNFFAQF